MAYFAQLDENFVVMRVIVVNNDAIDNLPFPASEQPGVELCQNILGNNTLWKQTSYNSNFRGIFAGIGYFYDQELDIFVRPTKTPA